MVKSGEYDFFRRKIHFYFFDFEVPARRKSFIEKMKIKHLFLFGRFAKPGLYTHRFFLPLLLLLPHADRVALDPTRQRANVFNPPPPP